MTWTYDPTTIASVQKDQVRYLIGDTDPNDWLLADEEITWVLNNERGVYYAAARCCQNIAALFGRKSSTSIGSLKVAAEKKYEHYLELYTVLRMQATFGDASPAAPAISIGSKELAEEDTDRVQPKFGRDIQDNPNRGAADPLKSRSPWSSWP